jgi:hypothetical protein
VSVQFESFEIQEYENFNGYSLHNCENLFRIFLETSLNPSILVIAECGGLLGLFLGFSFISVIHSAGNVLNKFRRYFTRDNRIKKILKDNKKGMRILAMRQSRVDKLDKQRKVFIISHKAQSQNAKNTK